ncbi:putative F-box/LRR-repeat protein 12 [Cocos nucifera]|uniref:Putative F-box/LRR-repeat protein 12 n=1 Tax=Cocos nucifera TaxID=13894 RepID=A0A8K0INC2_COCNU|nr:putative F-box/LRR-repeat protein 12 [Cocos nucifera]
MASRESAECQVKEVEAARVCINKVLTDADDELRAVLVRLEREEEKDTFGLVCKRWLRLQSSERRRLRARAGPAMLRRMADGFSDLVELDLSRSPSRSFYPGVTDSDLSVIAAGFRGLRILISRTVKTKLRKLMPIRLSKAMLMETAYAYPARGIVGIPWSRSPPATTVVVSSSGGPLLASPSLHPPFGPPSMGIPRSRLPSTIVVIVSSGGGCLGLLELHLEGGALACHVKRLRLKVGKPPLDLYTCLIVRSIGVIEDGVDEDGISGVDNHGGLNTGVSSEDVSKVGLKAR